MLQLNRVLAARNKWSHPDSPFTQEDFLDLLRPIFNILGHRNNELGDRCEKLIENIASGTEVNLAYFSSAFGDDFRNLEINNKKLLGEIEKYRSLSNFHFNIYPEEELKLQDLSREQLLNLSLALQNSLISARNYAVFEEHYSRDTILNEKLSRWLSEFALLINLFSIDCVSDYVEFEEMLNLESGYSSVKISEKQCEELLKCYLQELAVLVNEVIEIRKVLGIENCFCHYCASLDKYGLVPGTFSGDIFEGAVRHYLYFQTEDSIKEILERVSNEWMSENGISEDFFASIFPVQNEP